MISPNPYKHDIQVRVFRCLASSGQLGMRPIVVSQVFDFVPITGGAAWCVSSTTTESSACLRNGFQHETLLAFMIVNVTPRDACNRKSVKMRLIVRGERTLLFCQTSQEARS